jgi:3-hydroxy acid dehydrogenase/malonic semialdehyde reductase
MRSVFLTGGSSGIGLEFKNHLIANGYEVTAPTRQDLDLSNFNINDISLGSYDYLILCAGVDYNGRQPFVKLTESDFLNTINVNLIANMKLIHKYVQQRFHKSWSKVVIIGSTIVDKVYPNFVAYGTSKVALDTFVEALAQELEGNKIGFSRIHPGLVKTNFHYNRRNVSEENRYKIYDDIPHLTTDQLIPIFNQILNDQNHLIKKVSISV